MSVAQTAVSTKSQSNGTPMVTCQYCLVDFSIKGRKNHRVVKCPSCSCLTVLKKQVEGKIDVRCDCGTLYSAKKTAMAIKCDKTDCLARIPIRSTERQLKCQRCGAQFQEYISKQLYLLKCPECKLKSSIGNGNIKRGLAIWIMALTFFLSSIITMALTYKMVLHEGNYTYIAYIVLHCISSIVLLVSFCFQEIKEFKIDFIS